MCRQKGDSVCCTWRIYSGLLKGNTLLSLFVICIFAFIDYELCRSTAHTSVQHANKLRSLIDLLRFSSSHSPSFSFSCRLTCPVTLEKLTN